MPDSERCRAQTPPNAFKLLERPSEVKSETREKRPNKTKQPPYSFISKKIVDHHY